jgi:hypothetical protein
MSVYHRQSHCRVCGSTDVVPFLDLGSQPLANAFLKAPAEFAEERKYPLEVCFCQRCTLVQILDIVDPEVLFRNYIYVTGTSDTIREHNQRYACDLRELLKLQPTDLVTEIASNDGSLLACFQSLNVRTLGIEPARNIAEQARARGIEVVNEFFDASLATRVRAQYGPARAVIGNNVFAHVNDPADFLRGAAHLLAEDGFITIEVPYLQEFLERVEYDTVYHEHLSYFSITSLVALAERAELSLVRVDHVPVHGGSVRAYFGRPSHHGGTGPAVREEMARERQSGFDQLATYQEFSRRVKHSRELLLQMLTEFHKLGKQMAAYGAPAKGNTLLNYCGLDTAVVPYTVDKSPLKVGLYTPGMHLPVFSVETLLERQPDYTLILPWNFAEEIVRQQAEYVKRGGRFILPLPEPRII